MMNCPRCGFAIPAKEAKAFDDSCPSCGAGLSISAEELLSNPELGFVKEVRPGQVDYTKMMVEFLANPGHTSAMMEGGCGVGKTFGYGVPAVLSNKRVIISTGKKSLQDQLGDKDLGFLQRTLGRPRTFVSLKGKGNYICQRLLSKNEKMFKERHQERLHKRLTAWAKKDAVGDLDTFPGKVEFPATLCTADECTNCSLADKCGYMAVKQKVKEADTVVVNHSLLGFDLRLGVGRVLGAYEVLILDEAHTAADFIRRSFSEELTPTWMRNTFNKLVREQFPLEEFKTKRDPAEETWGIMFEDLPEEKLLQAGFLGDKADTVVAMMQGFEEDLTAYVLRRWSGMDDRAARDLLKKGTNDQLAEAFDSVRCELKDGDDDAEYDDYSTIAKILDQTSKKRIAVASTKLDDDNWINCQEQMKNGDPKILRQPVNLAPLTRGPMTMIDKVLFTSATLNMDLLKTEFGLMPKYELSVPSPFPYKRSLIYLPKDLPRPNEQGFHDAVGARIVDLTRASRGNALVLFSSLFDLRKVSGFIEENYEYEYPLYAQGNGRRPTELFQSFLDTDGAVLMGSKSFFEGIDVQGDKLRLVIIVKIPFPPREDPLSKAKEKILGRQSFWNSYYYPSMLNDIQQAAGRLVRTRDDRGVIALLDVRIWVGGNKHLDPRDVGTAQVPWKGYGHRIIKALPFPNFTPRFALVKQFYDAMFQPKT
jgi:Rad3-related DNA helicase